MSKAKVNIVFEQQLHCYGIITTLPDYMLLSLVNKCCAVNFKAIEDWLVDDSAERIVKRFVRFILVGEEDRDHTKALCISNKDHQHLLFKKIKDTDFVLCLPEGSEIEVEKIKNIQGITLLYPIHAKFLQGIEPIWEYSIHHD